MKTKTMFLKTDSNKLLPDEHLPFIATPEEVIAICVVVENSIVHRVKGCKNLCIENYVPNMFKKMLDMLYLHKQGIVHSDNIRSDLEQFGYPGVGSSLLEEES